MNNIRLPTEKIYPNWVLDTFRSYKLPEIFRKEGEDPCSGTVKKEIRAYQDFAGNYLYKTNQSSILIYHGLGSGKTVAAINVYNVLSSLTDNSYNVFVLLKASLVDDPWIKDLKVWLKDQKLMSTIHFIHYDSPFADKSFFETKKKVDATKKLIYMIEESHNFIRNVYSNIKSEKGGNAKKIYDAILEEKKQDPTTKIILLSGTPIINEPFELAILFNLLRPNIFPNRELEFNNIYVLNHSINLKSTNLFQRRIVGLVSYYLGATPDLYATKTINYLDLPMSPYHTKIYQYFENMEYDADQKQMALGHKSSTYLSYTRQACNFVFPEISDSVNGINRPRPAKFRITDKEAHMIDEGKEDKPVMSLDVKLYTETLVLYIMKLKEYLRTIAEDKKGPTIMDDLDAFKKQFTDYDNLKEAFLNFKGKSKLFQVLYDLSPKYLCACFYILSIKGLAMVYSNYVRMEGLEIFKIYLSLFGFGAYDSKESSKYHYGEYHGGISREARKQMKDIYNQPDNKYGSLIKLIMISPSGTEGINLENVRQLHLFEPYWNEVRMTQMIGRAIRQCSHKQLPMNERKVEVFRYKVYKHEKTVKDIIHEAKEYNETADKVNKKRINISTDTSDFIIESISRKKNNLNESFLLLLKQVAIDCQLFKNHNMLGQPYRCFQFSEHELLKKNAGPVYKDILKEDMKINDGLNSDKAIAKTVKVRKIMGILNNEKAKTYWVYDKSHVVYDYELHFPVGKLVLENGIPVKNKNDASVYIIHEHI